MYGFPLDTTATTSCMIPTSMQRTNTCTDISQTLSMRKVANRDLVEAKSGQGRPTRANGRRRIKQALAGKNGTGGSGRQIQNSAHVCARHCRQRARYLPHRPYRHGDCPPLQKGRDHPHHRPHSLLGRPCCAPRQPCCPRVRRERPRTRPWSFRPPLRRASSMGRRCLEDVLRAPLEDLCVP